MAPRGERRERARPGGLLTQRGARLSYPPRLLREHLSHGVERIELERQATPITAYEPLFTVGDLHCWPSRPFFEQLKEGAELAARGVDLESWWTDWRGQPFELVRGRDYDDVLLGLPPPVLAEVCGELAGASDA